jgi:hypothetical protein
MRKLTLRKGSFTVDDLAQAASIPRSTARDWIVRLSEEGCLTVLTKPHGRAPSTYAAISALPRTACRKIFTAVDGDMVEIVHECLSSACAAFCARHHASAHPDIRIIRQGTILREFGKMGSLKVRGLWPLSAVAITGIWRREMNSPTHPFRRWSGIFTYGDDGKADGVIRLTLSAWFCN